MPRKRKVRKLAPVTPRLNWSRGYERQIRKTVVTPFFNNVAKTFGDSLLHLDKQILSQADLSQLTTALNRTRVNVSRVNNEVDKVLTQLSHRHTMDVNRVFKQGIGVDIRPLLSSDAIRPLMEEKIAENVKLIVTMSENHKGKLLEKLHKDLVNKPFDRESITKFLRQGNKSSGYNLRRITRDQTNKVTGQLNQLRQTNLGIQKYEWGTSNDVRVRPTHRANNGKVFRWDTPPAVTGHPGELIVRE